MNLERLQSAYTSVAQKLNLPQLTAGQIAITPTTLAPTELAGWLTQQPNLLGGWLAWEQIKSEDPLFATDHAAKLKTALEAIRYPQQWPLEGELYGKDYSIQLHYREGQFHLLTIRDTPDGGEAVLWDTQPLLGKRGRTQGDFHYRRYWQPTDNHGYRPIAARLVGFSF